jgi:hypothetical protein
MVEWSEYHMTAIGPLNLNLEICGRFWIICGRILMIMHHNVLCTTCIALANCDRHLHMR